MADSKDALGVMLGTANNEPLRAFLEMAFILPSGTRRFGAAKLKMIYNALGGKGEPDFTARNPLAGMKRAEKALRKARY